MGRNDTISVSLFFQTMTERAVCVREDIDGDDVWLPLSQIEMAGDGDDYDRGDPIEIEAPEWLLLDKGLI